MGCEKIKYKKLRKLPHDIIILWGLVRALVEALEFLSYIMCIAQCSGYVQSLLCFYHNLLRTSVRSFTITNFLIIQNIV
jgi:hypothetical protein